MHGRPTFRTKKIDLVSDRPVAVLNVKDAQDMSIVAQDRILIESRGKEIVALVEITSSLVGPGCMGLRGGVLDHLGIREGDEVVGVPAEKPQSVEYIKKKMDGGRLTKDEITAIVRDIVRRNLSDIELAAYVSAVYTRGMDIEETSYLTKAMVETGETIEFSRGPIYDFHSVGGVPGNKITLMVVPIAAAGGLLIPKTCSRAISSACGTADIFEVLTNVSLSVHQIKTITETVGGVIAWGGAVNMAPADDLIIRAEYPLQIDPHSQLLASVLAKKKAVGSERLVIDIPMGPGTKVPDYPTARKFASDFIKLGETLEMEVECAITYGGQPVGHAIGPAAEAKEAMAALEGKKVPNSLLEKALGMAAILFSMDGRADPHGLAKELLTSGKALEKMKEIIEAQGGNPDITSDDIQIGEHKYEYVSRKDGYVKGIKNKAIVKITRAAGAPKDKGAAVLLHAKEGDSVDPGDVLFTIHADSERKLRDAVSVAQRLNPITVEGMILEQIPPSHRIYSEPGIHTEQRGDRAA
ncbi:MAG: AMP phosphorylase [Thermoplasmata archaeon]|nr:AMP phosphorylase [Thermoplasmata archaeon]